MGIRAPRGAWARIASGLRNSLLAGVCAAAVHSSLMALRDYLGILPEFQPYRDLQGIIGSAGGDSPHNVYQWLLPYLTGAMLIGFIFGRTYRFLPGSTAIRKGIVFGVCAWLLMGFGFLSLAGHGIFGTDMGLGIQPAALTLVMLLVYSIVMSLVYDGLSAH